MEPISLALDPHKENYEGLKTVSKETITLEHLWHHFTSIPASKQRMTSKVEWITFLCLLCLANGQSSTNQLNDAAESSKDIITGLYTIIRNIAFPAQPLDKEDGVTTRFLLLSPGKVLNYFDYYPGQEYTNYVQNLDSSKKETVVPPHVMEKWFDLADVVPSVNPLNAEDTGKSLSNIYRLILHQLKILGLDSKSESEKGLYNQALELMNELVADPENTTDKVPRLQLYERYRDLYNERRLEMEDKIEHKRQTLGGIDYGLWFQRHYPSLLSKVESAYTKWIIFGEKQLVELYIAVLDTGSAGQALEEARMQLRAAGVTSLDRTRTVYPVSFEPSDWYKYLLPKVEKPTKDQLQAILGTINSKINAINSMISTITAGNSNLTAAVKQLSKEFKNTEADTQRNVTRYLNAQFTCLGSKTKAACDEYESLKGSAVESLVTQSQAYSNFQFASYFTDSKEDYLAKLEEERDDYQSKANRVISLIGDAGPYLGSIIDDSALSAANLTDASRDDAWLQFDFDSSAYRENRAEYNRYDSRTSSWKAKVFFVRASGSSRSSSSARHFSKSVSNSTVKVKGELLRVTIKRPWFKPELFENPELSYQVSDDNGRPSYIAPGSDITETDYYNSVSNENLRYLLPEFPSAFLLARNLELEFSGLDDRAVYWATHQFSSYNSNFGFGPISVSHSRTKSRGRSGVGVHRTANGMRIRIPGAQLIGYYTVKLPRFPPNH